MNLTRDHTRTQPWDLGETPWEHAERYPPAHALPFFTKHNGYLADGDDIYIARKTPEKDGEISLAKAEQMAMHMPGCMGFWFKWQEMEEKGVAEVYFKNSWNLKKTTKEESYVDDKGVMQYQTVPVDPEPACSYMLQVPGKEGQRRLDNLTKRKGTGNVQKLMKWVRQEEQDKAWAVIHAVFCAIVAILFFIMMEVVWFYFYHKTFAGSVLILLALLVLAGLLILFGSGNGVLTHKQRTWVVCLGITCIFVTLLGLVFGFIMYFQHLAYYWRYTEMRTYTNVGASQPATAFNDGAMFLFTQDTRLDVLRSIGHRSQWSGKDMCVAPLVDSTMSSANYINFWAAGDSCCLARSQFMCDDAKDPDAMSALVMLEPWEVVRPFMRWAVRGAVFPRYVKSIKQQEAAYATRAATQIRLVYWVKDPIAKRDSFYYDARHTAIMFTLVLFFVLLVVCYIFCYLFRNQKKEDNQHTMKEFQKKKVEEQKAQRAMGRI